MAPQNPNPFDPDRIDISLDLVGSGSIEAVQQLTEQLRTVTTFMANAQAATPEGRAAGVRAVAQSFHPNVGGVHQGPHPYQSYGDDSPAVADGAGLRASVASIRHPGQFADRLLENYRRREQDQFFRRSQRGMGGVVDPYDPLSTSRVGGADQEFTMGSRGSISPGASIPDDYVPNSNDPLWRQALRANPVEWERSQEGIRLPPGGLSLSFQQKLEMASDFFTRRAERRYQQALADPARMTQALDTAQQEARSIGFSPEQISQMDISGITPDLTDVGQRQGRAAGLLRMGADNAAQMQFIAGDVRRAVSGVYNYAGGFQQAGTQAGFERAGQINIPGTNIGITNPLDFFKANSAAREGLNQRINIQRLRLMGGIDEDQARQIVYGLAGAGWTGEQGEGIAFDSIAPLVQQGMNPELATQSFDQIMRQGNASIVEFNTTMDHLGRSAQAANLSLDEYQQGLLEFAQIAKEHGATAIQGATLGRQLTDTLGIAPQVAAKLFDTPLVQAMAVQQGILPNEMGLMGANQMTTSLYGGMAMAMQATQGFRNQPIIDPTTGQRISGADRQMAQAASIMGMSVDEFRRLWRNREVGIHGGRAESLLDQYGKRITAGERLIRDRVDQGQHASTSTGAISPGDWVVTHAGAPGAVKMLDGQYAVKATVAGYGVKYDSDPRQGILPAGAADAARHQLDSGGDWNKIHRELMAMAPDRSHAKQRHDYFDQIKKIEGETGKKRIEDTKQLIRERSKVALPKDDGPVVYVKFKGAAAKYFEQDTKSGTKRSANAGGTSTAEASILPTDNGPEMLADFMRQQGVTGAGG